jgi:hypothetical protein
VKQHANKTFAWHQLINEPKKRLDRLSLMGKLTNKYWHALAGDLAHCLGLDFAYPGPTKWSGPDSGNLRHNGRNFHLPRPLEQDHNHRKRNQPDFIVRQSAS